MPRYPHSRVYGAPEGCLRMVTLAELKERRLAFDAALRDAWHRPVPEDVFEHAANIISLDHAATRARADEIDAFYAQLEPWGA